MTGPGKCSELTKIILSYILAQLVKPSPTNFKSVVRFWLYSVIKKRLSYVCYTLLKEAEKCLGI